MKRTVLIALMVMILLSFGGTAVFAKSITIGHISGSLVAFSQVRVKDAMEYLCKNKYSWGITSVECMADWNLANSQIENFVARKVDAITLAMMDLRSLKAGIDAASKAIMEHGFTRDDMFVVAADGHPSAYGHIRSPKDPFEATVAQKFDYFASITCDLIDKVVVKGVKPEKVVPKGMRIYVDSPIVDPTNVPAEGKLPWKLAWE